MSIRKLAHLSDLHFGKIAHAGVVRALVEEVNELGPDLVAISGDLTQRARTREYEAAATMLEALEPPALVVPGNHDVYPWWRPVSRLLRPLDRFHRYVSEDPTPSFEFDGLAVFGINSAFGRTVKGGRIRKVDQQALVDYFRPRPDAFKVLVVHHHLTRIQALGVHDVARRAQKTLDLAVEVGVDLILCGHLHVSHIEPIEIVPARHRLVIVSAGTSTSSRGRRQHRETNFYNRITVADDHFTVEERRYVPEEGRFECDLMTRFERDRG